MYATITNLPSHSWKTRAAAEKITADWDKDGAWEIRQRKDGRFIIAILDDETGEFIGCL